MGKSQGLAGVLESDTTHLTRPMGGEWVHMAGPWETQMSVEGLNWLVGISEEMIMQMLEKLKTEPAAAAGSAAPTRGTKCCWRNGDKQDRAGPFSLLIRNRTWDPLVGGPML